MRVIFRRKMQSLAESNLRRTISRRFFVPLGGNTHADMNLSTTAALRAVTSVTPDTIPCRPDRA